jgi:hypothetical protein
LPGYEVLAPELKRLAPKAILEGGECGDAPRQFSKIAFSLIGEKTANDSSQLRAKTFLSHERGFQRCLLACVM